MAPRESDKLAYRGNMAGRRYLLNIGHRSSVKLIMWKKKQYLETFQDPRTGEKDKNIHGERKKGESRASACFLFSLRTNGPSVCFCDERRKEKVGKMENVFFFHSMDS